MKRALSICAAVLLVAEAATVFAVFGPCNITVPAGFANTIVCTGSIIPPVPDGCAGAVTITVQQKACANANSDPCTNVANNLLVIRPALYVGSWLVGPCYGVRANGTVWSHDCVQGAPVAVPGGTNC